MSMPSSNPVAASTEPTAYPAQVDEHLARVPEPLTEEERTFFEGLIDEATAQRVGARAESAGVLDACLDACRTVLPMILQGRIPGYGALRARYLLDTARALADEVVQLDAGVVDAAAAGAARVEHLRGSRVLRQRGMRALRNLSSRSREQQARLKKLAEEVERPDTRARSLQAVARELEELIKTVPTRVAQDAGATPELIAALRAEAREVLGSRERAAGARGSVQSRYDLMNVLDGRILHELRALAGATRDARRHDRTVPALRVSLLRNGRRRKAAEPVEPAQVAEAQTA